MIGVQQKQMESKIPFSLNLSGGGLDQIYLNKFVPGWNLTTSIHADYPYKERSGMATSTRNTAIKKWQELPEAVYDLTIAFTDEKLARILFRAENESRTKYVSGFQDAAGICMKGIVACWYDNGYIPTKIKRTRDNEACDWLQNSLQLFELKPRPNDFNLFKNENTSPTNAERLAEASRICIDAIKTKDLGLLGTSFNLTRQAYANVFPESLPQYAIDRARELGLTGWKLNGAGGGGYIIGVTNKDLGGIPIRIRR